MTGFGVVRGRDWGGAREGGGGKGNRRRPIDLTGAAKTAGLPAGQGETALGKLACRGLLMR